MAYKFSEDEHAPNFNSLVTQNDNEDNEPAPMSYTDELNLIVKLSLCDYPTLAPSKDQAMQCVCNSHEHNYYILYEIYFCPWDLHYNLSMRLLIHVSYISRSTFPIIYSKYKLKQMQVRYLIDLSCKAAVENGLLLLQELANFHINNSCIS